MYDLLRTAFKLFLGRGRFISYSQFGEDAVITSVFRNKRNGTYIDIGAYHPHLYSNTYALYQRGWKGVVIDPNPRMNRLFRIFRPRDRFLLAGAGGSRGERTYYEYRDPAFNGFEKASTQDNPIRQRVVPILPLSDIIRDTGLRHIELLSIDAEGMDEEILRDYDWSVFPEVIVVEGRKDSPLAFLLEEQGYERLAQLGLSLVYKKRR